MPTITRLLFSALLLFVVLPAAADYGPGTQPNNPNGNNNSAQAGQQMAVPDYIKPGFQMTYMSMSSTESATPDKVGSAGMGFTVHTIIAVTKDKVLVTAASYLTPDGMPFKADGTFDPGPDPKAVFMGSNSYGITAMDVQGGNALWMPVKELAQWQSGNGVEVQRFPWPYLGKKVDSTTLFVKGNDFITSNTYHAGNGMKLTSRKGTGQFRRNATGNDPFDRKIQSQTQLLATRQLDSPLLGADWPDWAKTAKKMSYTGTYSVPIPGGDPIPPVQMAMEIEFTDRGQGYVTGKSSLRVQSGQPEISPVIEGPGTMFGFWIHPNLLANLDEGTIDRDKLTRTTTTYQVQQGNLGKLGVFVAASDSQTFYTVSGYNLETGALTYVNFFTADPDTTVEFKLSNIE